MRTRSSRALRCSGASLNDGGAAFPDDLRRWKNIAGTYSSLREEYMGLRIAIAHKADLRGIYYNRSRVSEHGFAATHLTLSTERLWIPWKLMMQSLYWRKKNCILFLQETLGASDYVKRAMGKEGPHGQKIDIWRLSDRLFVRGHTQQRYDAYNRTRI